MRYSSDCSVEISEDFLGICPTIALNEDELDIIESIGAKWIRHDFPWDIIEEKQGTWNFVHWDGFVARAKQQGRKILAILDYDVSWIHDDLRVHKYVPPDKLSFFLTYVEQLIKRYKHDVAAVEVWNEPNARRFWKGSQEDFFKLAAETAKLVKSLDPDMKVVGGSVLFVPKRYLDKMFDYGVLNQVDAVSFHPYSLNPDGVMRQIDTMRSIIAENGFGRELWITEVGFPTGGWYPGARSETKQADYAVKIMVGAAIRNVRIAIWYELFDTFPDGQAYNPLDIENHFGIVRSDQTQKAAAIAFALVGKFVPGSRYSPNIVNIDTHLAGRIEVLPFVKADGTTAVFLWSTRKQAVRLSIDGGVSNLSEHNIYTGDTKPILQRDRLELTSTPTLISFVEKQSPVTVTVHRAREASHQ